MALGEGFKYEDFASDPELAPFDTPIYDRYNDDVDGRVDKAPDDETDDTDTLDQYAGAEVLLPIGGKIMNAKVRGRKRFADGSVVGCANANPILVLKKVVKHSVNIPYNSTQTTYDASTPVHPYTICLHLFLYLELL